LIYPALHQVEGSTKFSCKDKILKANQYQLGSGPMYERGRH
jgi:hypothetical protein